MNDTRRSPMTSSWHSRCPPYACTLQAQSVLSDSSPQPAGGSQKVGGRRGAVGCRYVSWGSRCAAATAPPHQRKLACTCMQPPDFPHRHAHLNLQERPPPPRQLTQSPAHTIAPQHPPICPHNPHHTIRSTHHLPTPSPTTAPPTRDLGDKASELLGVERVAQRQQVGQLGLGLRVQLVHVGQVAW